MNDYGKAVREALKANGCHFLRHGRGDYIKSRHTANGILKDAGIAKQF